MTNLITKAKIADGGVYFYNATQGFWACREDSMVKFMTEVGVDWDAFYVEFVETKDPAHPLFKALTNATNRATEGK